MARPAHIWTILIALFSIGLVAALVTHPETSFQAAVRGLKIWWDVVFPALLPFIVVAEVLMGVGVVHFVGVLLEPLMRPFFNVPGTGGFVMTMGFSSGYPVAAKLTTRLREQGHISRAEGERLVSFATTGDPLFVIGAVAVGFFHSEQLGVVLASAHYLSAVLLGVLYRFHAYREPASKPAERQTSHLLFRAMQAMHRTRISDGRPFGQLLGDAVFSALNTLFMVGGFIILFSVLIHLLAALKIEEGINLLLHALLSAFGLPSQVSHSFVAGMFEVTLGAQAVGELSGAVPLMWKAAIASAIVSWGGWSVHAQVASILSSTDIRFSPYLVARALHAFLAAGMTVVLWSPLNKLMGSSSIPAWTGTHSFLSPIWPAWWVTGKWAVILLAVLLLASLVVRRVSPR